MHATALSQFEQLLQAMVDVREQTDRARRALQQSLSYPLNWLRMWRIAAKVERVRARTQSAWEDVRTFHRSANGFFALPAECGRLLHQVRGLRDEVRESLNCDELLISIFPSQGVRIRDAKTGILKLCDDIIAVVPQDNPTAIENAKRQHERGELLDFETFANGLLGVQR